jgi:hypothetical protein
MKLRNIFKKWKVRAFDNLIEADIATSILLRKGYDIKVSIVDCDWIVKYKEA